MALRARARTVATAAAAAQRQGGLGRRWLSSALPDPHSISAELDEATSDAIIHRLEARGRDAVFRSLFATYFDAVLASCENVLEVGCGTGVVCRALAARAQEMGAQQRLQLTGVDQSPAFVEAARRLARDEGLDVDMDGGGARAGSRMGSRLAFHVGDATALGEVPVADDSPARLFDGIVMHTLISHVPDPLAVLRAAREVASPGARVFIVDGDYPTLSYHHSDDPALGRLVDKSLVEATFCSPGVVRQLPRLLQDAGFVDVSGSGLCVSEVGTEFSYWKSFAQAYLPRVVASGLVEQAVADRWWAAQQRAAEDGAFFASCSYFTIEARVPTRP